MSMRGRGVGVVGRVVGGLARGGWAEALGGLARDNGRYRRNEYVSIRERREQNTQDRH